MPYEIWVGGELAWQTGNAKVDIYSGKEVFEYRTSTGKSFYRSKDGTVFLTN